MKKLFILFLFIFVNFSHAQLTGELVLDNVQVGGVQVEQFTLKYKFRKVIGRPIVATSIKWTGEQKRLPDDLKVILHGEVQGKTIVLELTPDHSYPSKEYGKNRNHKFSWDKLFRTDDNAFLTKDEAKAIWDNMPILFIHSLEGEQAAVQIENVDMKTAVQVLDDEIAYAQKEFEAQRESMTEEQIAKKKADLIELERKRDRAKSQQHSLRSMQADIASDQRSRGYRHHDRSLDSMQQAKSRKASSYNEEVSEFQEEQYERVDRYNRRQSDSGDTFMSSLYQGLQTLNKDLEEQNRQIQEQNNQIIRDMHIAQERKRQEQRDANRLAQQRHYQQQQQLQRANQQRELDAKRERERIAALRAEQERQRKREAEAAERRRREEAERQRKLAEKRRKEEAERQRKQLIAKTRTVNFSPHQSSQTWRKFTPGEKRTGTLTVRNFTLAGVRVSSLSVRYSYGAIFGEATHAYVLKWTPQSGEAADNLPPVDIELVIDTSAGRGIIECSPLVPKPNQWGFDVSGSPSWGSFMKSYGGYHNASTAKAIYKAGGKIYIKSITTD